MKGRNYFQEKGKESMDSLRDILKAMIQIILGFL